MKTSPAEAVRKLYQDSAASYAQMMDAEIKLPLYTEVLSRLAEQLEGTSGPLLDTSCGTGHMLWRYRQEYDKTRQLLGVDLSPEMIAVARERLGSGAEITLGDMRGLHFIASDSVAAAISFFALHHLSADEVLAALREWHRVLAPGGSLVLATWSGTGPIDYGGASDIVALRYEEAELQAWLRAAGFTLRRSLVAPVPEMEMDAVYLDAVKPPENEPRP